ncbi:C2H2 finger domain protein [Penicillium malachiteum]|uniref:C2H2 finger domain protein n=1 Tax=Penicillium malachiteum TaxID=1324776 RepID=UPI0025489D40|nr:C2H2 finger domain protein [Penicillium malachiteum]KAJ5736997.1 C2H2 finger domain protein [Penicillium malachiteum]
MSSSKSSQPAVKNPPKVPCTFKDCPRVFNSESEMLEHKQQDSNHAYCFKCKVDFPSQGVLFIHKITNDKHFTCPLCNLDFRCSSGRARHIQLNHPVEQNIDCAGCGKKFKSASTLMKHIEYNECPKISIARMLLEQHRREQVANAWQERAREGPMGTIAEKPVTLALLDTASSASTTAIPLSDAPIPKDNLLINRSKGEVPRALSAEETSGSPGDNEAGGILIDVSCDSPEPVEYPYLTAGQESAQTEEINNSKQEEEGRLIKLPTPTLDPMEWPFIRRKPKEPNNCTLEDILMEAVAIDEDGRIINPDAELPNGPADLVRFQRDDDEESLSGTNRGPAPDGNFGIPLQPVTELLRQHLPDWNPERFWNEGLQRYVCVCGFETKHERAFEYHVAMERRWITATQCLQCGRIFPSTTALVAHMEQVRSRCAVRENPGFARFLGDITGGLIQVRGALEDGSDRIVARKLENASIRECENLILPDDMQEELNRLRKEYIRGHH